MTIKNYCGWENQREVLSRGTFLKYGKSAFSSYCKWEIIEVADEKTKEEASETEVYRFWRRREKEFLVKFRIVPL